MTNLNISVITELDSFEFLQYEWNTLLEKSNSQSVFLTWDWLYAWWCEFRQDRLLNIVIVRDKFGILVGIGPFCINKKLGVVPIRVLSYLGVSPISSEYLDIIVDPAVESEVSSLVFQQVESGMIAWDCMILTDMLDSACAYKHLTKKSFQKDFIVEERVAQECPFLRLDSPLDEIFKRFNSQLRSTIKRRTKKLEKRDAELRIVKNDKELPLFLSKLFALHQKCWNARGVKGNFSDDKIKSFHKNATRYLLSNDFLKLCILQVDGDAISALYAFQYKKTLFYYQSGFNPEWSSYSPGTVLMWKCISDASDRGMAEFDYLRGAEPYKKLWSNNSRKTLTLTRIPRGRFTVRVYFFLVKIKKCLKSIVIKMISMLRKLKD